jgi:hypothetical protein
MMTPSPELFLHSARVLVLNRGDIYATDHFPYSTGGLPVHR